MFVVTYQQHFKKQACQQNGIPHTNDFNTGTNEGVSYFEVNQKRGTRWNARLAFLGTTPSTLTIQTNTHIARILFDSDRRATGLQLADDSVVEARREIVLTAGSIGSPAILERSGIGCAKLLHRLGKDTLVDNAHVGENLCDHLQLRMVFSMAHGVSLNSMYHSWPQRIKMGLEYLLHQSGPLSMAPSQLGVFTRSDGSKTRPNLQYHVQPLSLDKFGEPLHRFDAITASVCNLQPTSRGSTHIVDANDALAPPRIAPNYLSTEHDRQVARDALRRTRLLITQPALSQYGLKEHMPGALLQR
jgi:choline dehydrogenase